MLLLGLVQWSYPIHAKINLSNQHPQFILPSTEVRYLKSKVNGINYKIYINIPASYHHSNKNYPAMYVLDANYSFPLAKQIVEHLNERNRIEDVFIIGIAYDGPPNYKLNRTRDYTPTFVKKGGYGPEYQKASGGAKLFKQFIHQELIPYLNKHFRLNQKRTLVGHSFGGLFATWLLLEPSADFQNYIIVSPSLWYDNKFLLNAKIPKNLKGKAFFAIGENENDRGDKMVDDLNHFVERLKEEKHLDLSITHYIFNSEDHDTVFPAALGRGIKFIYSKDKK